ncbi:MAG: MBL fold metallo-hydrolase, partial [Pseudomonadota bacterium]|nr:MBL fold metallo-hydrolase [Pseudomonadota bacterium]
RTAAYEADTLRVARHALKVVLIFALLDKQRLAAADLPTYIDRIEIYREFNQRLFRLPPATLAKLLVDDLERAGAVRRDNGWLRPG